MKKNIYFILCLVLILLPIGVPLVTRAENEGSGKYTTLAPLPNTTDCDEDIVENNASREDCQTNLEEYLPAVFNLLIGISIAFVVVNMVWGGFVYMTSEAIGGKMDGKNRIINSIKGLLLVASAWIILNSINPELLGFHLDIKPVDVPIRTTGEGETTGYIPLTEADIKESNDMRAYLLNNGGAAERVNTYAGPCTTTGQSTGCVNLNGLPVITRDGLKTLKKSCGLPCDITITGGTEGGHTTHGPNKTPVDLRPNSDLRRYVTNNKIGDPVQTSLGLMYTVKVGDRTATFLRESDHWHVTF